MLRYLIHVRVYITTPCVLETTQMAHVLGCRIGHDAPLLFCWCPWRYRLISRNFETWRRLTRLFVAHAPQKSAFEVHRKV